MLGSQNYTCAVDMWSTACIIVEMANRRPCFAGDNEIEQLHHIFHLLGTPSEQVWTGLQDLPYWRNNFPTWPGMSLETVASALGDNGTDLIEQMFLYDPVRRLTAAAALSHPYVANAELDAALVATATASAGSGIDTHAVQPGEEMLPLVSMDGTYFPIMKVDDTSVDNLSLNPAPPTFISPATGATLAREQFRRNDNTMSAPQPTAGGTEGTQVQSMIDFYPRQNSQAATSDHNNEFVSNKTRENQFERMILNAQRETAENLPVVVGGILGWQAEEEAEEDSSNQTSSLMREKTGMARGSSSNSSSSVDSSHGQFSAFASGAKSDGTTTNTGTTGLRTEDWEEDDEITGIVDNASTRSSFRAAGRAGSSESASSQGDRNSAASRPDSTLGWRKSPRTTAPHKDAPSENANNVTRDKGKSSSAVMVSGGLERHKGRTKSSIDGEQGEYTTNAKVTPATGASMHAFSLEQDIVKSEDDTGDGDNGAYHKVSTAKKPTSTSRKRSASDPLRIHDMDSHYCEDSERGTQYVNGMPMPPSGNKTSTNTSNSNSQSNQDTTSTSKGVKSSSRPKPKDEWVTFVRKTPKQVEEEWIAECLETRKKPRACKPTKPLKG